jgi:hypothetical protein
MRPKKSKEPKKYIAGGIVAAGALGGLQSLLGAGQMLAGMGNASKIKKAPTARPSEYSEMLKQARGAELEQKRLEELNRTISTGIGAAQSAGGRAVIGALPGMVRAADVGAMDILGQRQAQTLEALGFAAQGAENEIARKTNREMMERQAAQSAIEGGLQNIAGGLGQAGSALVYGSQNAKKPQEDRMQETSVPERSIAEVASPSSLPSAGSMVKRSSPIPSLSGLENVTPELLRSLEKGGMITDGKFDHKTNPIDIVQRGKKVGEMTGGEVILNPSQQKKLSKESAYFRQLLKKFNKQK